MKFSNWKKPTRLEELTIWSHLALTTGLENVEYFHVHSFKQTDTKLIANVEYVTYYTEIVEDYWMQKSIKTIYQKPKFIKVEI